MVNLKMIIKLIGILLMMFSSILSLTLYSYAVEADFLIEKHLFNESEHTAFIPSDDDMRLDEVQNARKAGSGIVDGKEMVVIRVCPEQVVLESIYWHLDGNHLSDETSPLLHIQNSFLSLGNTEETQEKINALAGTHTEIQEDGTEKEVPNFLVDDIHFEDCK